MTQQTVQRPTTAAGEFARGWPVLVGALICYAVSVVAIPAYTSGVYMTDLVQALGVTRGQLSMSQLITTAVLLVVSPSIGLVADRFGMRVPIGLSLVGMGVVYALMGTVMHTFPVYLLLQGLLNVVGAATLPVVFTRAVNGWFDRARGLALGCVLVGTGITAAIGPPLVAAVISAHGWRAGYLATAVVVLAAMPVVVWLVKLPPWETRSTVSGGAVDADMTLRQAMRRPVFWILAVAFMIQALAALGLMHHMVAMLTDTGLTKVKAAGIFSIAGIAILCGRFLVGALVDHVFAPWLAAAIAAVFAAGCLLLAFGGVHFAPVSAFTTGFVVGAEVDFIGFLASRYFGLRHYGRIYGWLYAAFALGAGLSTAWMGRVFDMTGSYRLALLISAGLMVPVIGLLLCLPRYADPHRASAQQQEA